MAALVVSTLSWPVAAQDPPVDPERRAYELFRQSEAEYRAGRFAAAAALLEEAYRLDAESVLVYNLARAYEGMGELERAIDAYRRYLSDEPNARDRGAIEARLATLTRQLDERRALDRLRQQRETGDPDTRETDSATPDLSDPDPDPPQDRDEDGDDAFRLTLPWIVAGIGAAGVATGFVLGAMAGARHDDAVSEPGFLPAMELQNDAEQLATGANVALIVGGVVLATGVTWGVLELLGANDDEPARPSRRATARSRRPRGDAPLRLRAATSIGFVPLPDGGAVSLRTPLP